MIQHAAEHILERVNLASGSRIRALKIDHTTRPAPALDVRKRQPPPLSIEDRNRIAKSLADVETPELRRALGELGEAVLSSARKARA